MIPSLKHRKIDFGLRRVIPSSVLGHRTSWKMYFAVGLGDEVEVEYKRISAVEKADKCGKRKFWLLYALPFLVTLTLGYISAIFFGNLIFQFLINFG